MSEQARVTAVTERTPGSTSPVYGRESLAVAIVNWRAADLTIDCLTSLASQGDFDLPPITYVVDNDSRDGSFEKISQAVHANGWQGWVRMLAAERNGGFAYGNNLAIRAVLRELPNIRFVHLLNPDTIVRPGAFRELLAFAAAHPRVGIIGGRSEDPDASPQFCAFRFPTAISEFASYLRIGIVDRLLGRWATKIGIPEAARQVDWVSGAHMLVRREVFDAIGLLDEGYFLYFEETDFTLRARRAGWSCWHVPASRIVHLVGRSSGISSRDPARSRLPAYWFESRRRYFVLNYGRAYALVTDIAVVVAFLAWRLRRRLQSKPDPDPPHFLADFIAHGALRKGERGLPPRLVEP